MMHGHTGPEPFDDTDAEYVRKNGHE
jgi:hypothetical protein